MGSDLVMSVGALCFGFIVGYITYRTLMRTEKTAIADLPATIGAIGGGAVTALFNRKGDLFGWYSIGLIVGFAGYFLLCLKMHGREKTGDMMGIDIVEPRGRERGDDWAGGRQS